MRWPGRDIEKINELERALVDTIETLGFWFGIIRVNVGGNVVAANTSGTQVGLPGTEFEGILDSTEIVSNVIGGNLICHGNTPPAQIGDAILDEGNGPNTVGGNALGECADVSE